MQLSPRLALACVAIFAAMGGAGLWAGDNRSITDLHLKLIWVPPGEFDMGTKMSGRTEVMPVTHVVLSRGFWLGQTEVTQRQWRDLMGAHENFQEGDSLPVDKVDWDMAVKFCEKLTARERAAGRLSADLAFTLPTEAEWEYACRAGRTGYDIGAIKRVFIDFTEIDAMSWNEQNSDRKTHPVGRKKPNAWGFYDMQGNVTEWCLNSFKYDYPGGTVTDPIFVPADTNLRFYRGGAATYPHDTCTSTFRWWEFRYGFTPTSGFRIALCAVR